MCWARYNMKKRKLELWSSELFTGCTVEGAKAYDHLNGRELIIVGAAVIDSALLELIELRLVNNNTEQDGLLGITKFDCPVSSLTSRARLAFLLGLIRQVESETIRLLANLRNHVAHRASAKLDDPEVLKYTEKLLNKSRIAQAGNTTIVNEMIEACRKDPKFIEAIIRNILLDYQFNFDKRKGSIKRLAECSIRMSTGGFVCENNQ